MGLVRRKKRTAEQIAATNAKRAATIAAKKAVSANVETPQTAETTAAEVSSAKAEKPTEVPAQQPATLPKHLQDRISAMAGIQDDLAKEIEEFKSGEAYLEGDIPVTLHGVGGPGFAHGQRSLNYIDVKALDPLYHYRWSHKSMVDFHRADGYQPVDHVDFSRTVTARGSGHSFGKTPEGHVFSGDLILVKVSKDWHDKLSARIREKTKSKEGRAKNNVYAKGEALGVDVYEGGEAMSPRMENLMRFLEKELGPGARQAYLGS